MVLIQLKLVQSSVFEVPHLLPDEQQQSKIITIIIIIIIILLCTKQQVQHSKKYTHKNLRKPVNVGYRLWLYFTLGDCVGEGDIIIIIILFFDLGIYVLKGV